jgi:hypothetical protein
MSIETRLHTLETQIIGDDSTVCACYPERFQIYIQNLGVFAATNEPVLSGTPSPDICPNCRKPTEKNSITVQILK